MRKIMLELIIIDSLKYICKYYKKFTLQIENQHFAPMLK